MFATYNDKEISYFLNDKQVMKEDAKYFYFAGAAHERHKFLLDAKDFDNLDPVSEAQHIINTGLKK